jgi:hypothetical protein
LSDLPLGTVKMLNAVMILTGYGPEIICWSVCKEFEIYEPTVEWQNAMIETIRCFDFKKPLTNYIYKREALNGAVRRARERDPNYTDCELE